MFPLQFTFALPVAVAVYSLAASALGVALIYGTEPTSPRFTDG